MADFKPETLAISSGRPERLPGSGLNVGIELNSTFAAGGLGYGRFGNPSWSALEETISALEGAASTSIFSSGMAAITAVFSLLPHGAPVVASHEGYSGTMALLKKRHEQGSLEVRFVDISNTAEVLKALDGAAFLWIESPTNPGLNLAESERIIKEAKKRNLGVGFDNTFATPLNQQPLSMGADIVMHSVTKYLAGHSDVILGSISVNDPALQNRIVDIRTQQGAIAGPFESWLALRGIRTFPLRFRKAQESAALISEKLKAHPMVSDVRYPGFGAIVSFCVNASADAVETICDSAELITNATSLGGVESTWERRRRWALESTSVPENLVRLSVGCEDPDDIWSDINRAIERSSN